MSKKDDGGPAFPRPYDSPYLGMSMRDYFAGQALIAFGQDVYPEPKSAGTVFAGLATAAYLMADAMLKAREQ